ncbi:hypothetical protein HYALB_00001232 [Hymenoscyphus albidus]|uniref:Uncharacterized protein n=1 Tax=Hymenoscyphus albidus TaxID=595503 RepID=A0A9N9PY88_9HELO|nr:hypothetical protein HYALB_00001232 [Hymenoscyphus albidus]
MAPEAGSSKIDVTIAQKSTRTPSLELEINRHVENGRLGRRAVDAAFIKPVPHVVSGDTWHTTQGDPREHITVEFSKDGKHVTTHHVYRIS